MKDGKIDFFICHAQEEYPIAQRFDHVFGSLGAVSFVAHKSLPKGEDWHLHIIEKLNNSKNILIIATENLNNRSQYCHFEIGYAEAKGLKKHIFFLDNILFSPYIDLRHQGYKINKKNIADTLRLFFSEIGYTRIDDVYLKYIDESIYEYYTTLTRAENVLEALRDSKELDSTPIINKLDDNEKKKVITGILHDVELDKTGTRIQTNTIAFLITLFNNEKSSEIRYFFIRQAFGLLKDGDSPSLVNLVEEMCKIQGNSKKSPVQYTSNEIDFIKNNYLDAFIDFFAKKTRDFECGRTFAQFLAMFKHRFEKNQLEKIYVAMLFDNQINGQDFKYTKTTLNTLKEIFQAQSKEIPKIIEDMTYIDDKIKEEGSFDVFSSTDDVIRAQILMRYPDLFEKYQPDLFKIYTDLGK